MSVPSSGTAASLLVQAQDGRPEAWERLVGLYTPLLHTWLTSAGLQSADRDDLSQRVLGILFRKLPSFVHNGRPGAFRAWLRAITSHLLQEFWRERPTAGAESVLAQLADPAGGLSRLWDQQHDRHVLHALMELVRPEFTESTWQAFRRVALDGVPASSVGKELDLTANAVLIAKSRVLTRLRQEARGLVD